MKWNKFKLHEFFFMIFLKNFYLFILSVLRLYGNFREHYTIIEIFFQGFAKEFLLRYKNNDTFSSIIKEISRTLLPNEISMCLNFHNDGFAYFPLVGYKLYNSLQASENL